MSNSETPVPASSSSSSMPQPGRPMSTVSTRPMSRWLARNQTRSQLSLYNNNNHSDINDSPPSYQSLTHNNFLLHPRPVRVTPQPSPPPFNAHIAYLHTPLRLNSNNPNSRASNGGGVFTISHDLVNQEAVIHMDNYDDIVLPVLPANAIIPATGK